jgi:hypothetical protein
VRLAVVIALVCAVFTSWVYVPAAGAAAPLLPDLTQETPYDLGVVTDGRRHHLGFASVVYNYGDGPLRILGERESQDDPTMTADQVIDQDDGTHLRKQGIGELRYVDAITHRHWHYLKFDTYSLRRPDGSLARADRKTGFCLGDRLVAPDQGPLPAKPPFGEFGSNCGFDSPQLLTMEEGISVGYGDDYGPQLEGQYVDLTRLPAGRYVLAHRVNADGALEEKTLANNASSVLIDLRYRRGVPRVTQVERCPLSATCPVAPALSRGRATRFARLAFKRAYRERVSDVACRDPQDGQAACTGTVGDVVVTVLVRYSVIRGRLYRTFTAPGGDRATRGRVGVDLGRKTSVPVERQGSFPPRGVQTRARAGYCPLIARG